MGIGDEEPAIIDILSWHDLYNRADIDEDAIIDGLAFRGRWTAIAAKAKEGKSTVILALVVEAGRAGYVIVYLDAEMGRGDVLERVEDWMCLKPDDLGNVHYSDLPPKLDTVQGATELYNTVVKLGADLVVLDGLNGVVNGAENDDTTWRDFYEWAIHPLKQRGVAILSTDNVGHGDRKGPRGSSVKLDKADAIMVLERTDSGAKVTATHRRTAAYPKEIGYTVTDADESGPPMKVARVDAGSSAPHGTNQIIKILDELGVPTDAGRRPARRALLDAGYEAPRNSELGAMLKWRRLHAADLWITGTGPGTNGDQRDQSHSGGPQIGDHPLIIPARSVVPDGGSILGPPASRDQFQRGPVPSGQTSSNEPPPTIEDALG